MATAKSNRIRVGVFAIAIGVLVAIVLVVFAGMRWWAPRDRYHVIVDDSVFGLEAGAQVMLNGIRVGTVDGMATKPDAPGLVDVTIAVKRGLPIRTDTEALLRYVGVTGIKVIDLRGGNAAAPPLPPGSTIRLGETTLDEVTRKGQELLDQSQELMNRAQGVMAQTETVVANVAALTDPTGDIVANARITSAKLARTSAALAEMVDENRAVLSRSLASVDRAAASAADLAADLDGVVKANQTQLRSTLADVRDASRSFRDLARELRERPSRLLFSKAPKDRKLP
jgi:phospholipid/cholesterol/gamma-HCH transport system substrate-binding protein